MELKPYPIEKLSNIRKYFFEYIVVILVLSNMFMFKQILDLNKYIREKFEGVVTETNQKLYESTNATNQFLNYQRTR